MKNINELSDDRRKICIVTGTRAEYGLLKPVIQAIHNHSQLCYTIVATGMHLEKEFGYTLKEIKKDGFHVGAMIRCHPKEDTGVAMAAAIGEGIPAFARLFSKIQPDILLVLGDRMEVLAAVIAAAYQNIPIAHVHGGDRTRGGLDESARHAITKFAHLHFAATKKSAERLANMGEDAWRIQVVGAPGLDTILHAKLRDEEDVLAEYRLQKPYLLVVQHPVTTQVHHAAKQMQATLDAIARLNMRALIVYPNSDAGGRAMIDKITTTVREASQKSRLDKLLQVHTSLPHRDYLSLLRSAAVLVGNSSSGMIESSSFHCPVVNIGIRQEGRERAANVIDAAHSSTAIQRAIQKARSPSFQRKARQAKNPYGDGFAGKRIATILSQIMINERLLQKKLSY